MKVGAEKRFPCKVRGCCQSFSTSGHLTRHLRIHTGERPHECMLLNCTSRFSRKDNMMQHYRSHKKRLISNNLPVEHKPCFEQEISEYSVAQSAQKLDPAFKWHMQQPILSSPAMKVEIQHSSSDEASFDENINSSTFRSKILTEPTWLMNTAGFKPNSSTIPTPSPSPALESERSYSALIERPNSSISFHDRVGNSFNSNGALYDMNLTSNMNIHKAGFESQLDNQANYESPGISYHARPSYQNLKPLLNETHYAPINQSNDRVFSYPMKFQNNQSPPSEQATAFVQNRYFEDQMPPILNRNLPMLNIPGNGRNREDIPRPRIFQDDVRPIFNQEPFYRSYIPTPDCHQNGLSMIERQ